MQAKLLKRIERLELATKSSMNSSVECICFPRHRSPFFFYCGVEEIAFRVKCRIHGDRFVTASSSFMDDLHREFEVGRLWHVDTEQYRKAWNASFSAGSWPVEQIEIEGRTWLLPRSPEGQLLDWKNASPLPPWKRIKAFTIEDHRTDTGTPESLPRKITIKDQSKYEEARRLIEEFGCPDN